jgi:hypothetical protein
VVRSSIGGNCAGTPQAMRELSVLVDGKRLSRYSRMAVACYGLLIFGLWAMANGNVGPDGRPIGADFITFWSAGRLSLAGVPEAAFDAEQMFAMQRIAAPAYGHVFLWHYPPTYQLVAVPLGVPSYLVSYYLFAGLSLAVFVLALRPLVPWREAGVLLLALPATLICTLHGQNSLISAALMATAIMTLERRPVLAGVSIGLLAYKPQLGLLFPLVLAATGRWRVIAAAGATVAVLVLASMAAFGAGLWLVFLDNVGVVRGVVESGQLPWSKMPSAFVFLRKLGVPQTYAYAGQVAVAAFAAGLTLMVWRRCAGSLLAGATLVAGTLLLTPYTFDYEMAMLAIPLAVIARHLVRHGASLGERWLLAGIAASPVIMVPIADKVGIQIGFAALLVTFLWSARLALGLAQGRDIPAAPASLSLGASR